MQKGACSLRRRVARTFLWGLTAAVLLAWGAPALADEDPPGVPEYLPFCQCEPPGVPDDALQHRDDPVDGPGEVSVDGVGTNLIALALRALLLVTSPESQQCNALNDAGVPGLRT